MSTFVVCNVKQHIMRNLIKILFTLFLFSCNNNLKENKNINSTKTEKQLDSILGQKLIENDFLKFAEKSKYDSLKFEIINSFYIYNDENYKFVTIDAEELTEYNFDFFMPKINKILERRKLHLTVKKSNDYEISNEITINDDKIKLYKKEELDYNKFWESGPRNFFIKVNEILEKSGSIEKFYLLYSGNDLATILLTKKQFEIIKERFQKDSKEIPYKP